MNLKQMRNQKIAVSVFSFLFISSQFLPVVNAQIPSFQQRAQALQPTIPIPQSATVTPPPPQDTTAPKALVTIRGGITATKENKITVDIEAQDDGQYRVAEMRYAWIKEADLANPNFNWSNAVAYAETAEVDVPAQEGKYRLHFEVKDAAGNWSGPIIVQTLSVDRTKPAGTMKISVDPTRPAGELILDFTGAQDNLSGVAKMEGSWDNGVTWGNPPVDFVGQYVIKHPYTVPWTAGKHKFMVRYIDAAGSVSDPISSNEIDWKPAPPEGSVFLQWNAPFSSSNKTTIVFNPPDYATVSKMRGSFDGGKTWGDPPVNFQPEYPLDLQEGTHTFMVMYQDKNGVWSRPYTSNTLVIDKQKPSGGVGGSVGGLLGRVNLNITASDNASGIEEVQISWDGSTAAETVRVTRQMISSVNSNNVGFSLSNLKPSWTTAGPQDVYARFKDKAGNVSDWIKSAAPIQFTPAPSKPAAPPPVTPALQLTGNPSATVSPTTPGSVSIEVQANQPMASGLLSYRLNTSSSWTPSTSLTLDANKTKGSFNLSNLAAGVYEFNVSVKGAAGNGLQTSNFNFTIPPAPPTPPVVTPSFIPVNPTANVSATTPGEVSFEVQTSKPMASAELSYRPTGASNNWITNTAVTLDTAKTKGSFKVSNLAAGDYEFKIQVKDAAGNTADSVIGNFKIVQPSIQLTGNPTANVSATAQGQVSIGVQASQPIDSAVLSYRKKGVVAASWTTSAVITLAADKKSGTFTVQNLAAGDYEYNVVVKASATNVVQSSQFTFTIPQPAAPPPPAFQVTDLSDADKTYVSFGYVSVIAKANQPITSGTLSYRKQGATTTWILITPPQSFNTARDAANFHIPPAGLTGIYEYKVELKDANGNAKESAVKTFTLP